MKKKFTALFLVTAMLLSSLFVLVSCQKTPLDGDDAMAAIAYVDEKMDSLKSYSMKAAAKVAGQEIMKMDASFDLSGESPKFTGTVESNGLKMNLTYVDGILYSESQYGGVTQKSKQKMDADTAMESLGTPSLGDDLEYSEAEFVSKEKGKYELKASLSAADAKKYVREILAGQGLTPSAASMDVTYHANKDGYATKLEMAFSITVTGQKINENIMMEFSDFNDIPKITAPADADDYKAA